MLEHDALPDSLRAGLKLVFVGTAAGRRSAAVGGYYAHPGNRFWPILYECGITSRRFDPHEFPQLLDLGIGFTDVAKRAAGMDHEIAAAAFVTSTLAQKITELQPRVVAFTSKRAASFFLERPTRAVQYGLQKQTVSGSSAIFVLPSPSGAASRYWSVKPWEELAAFIR